MTSLGLYLLLSNYGRRLQSHKEELKGARPENGRDRELIDILFERLPVLITVYDPQLEEIEVNREFEKVTRYGSEEIGRKGLLECCFPDMNRREEVVEFMKNPGLGWREFTMATKSGKSLETSWTSVRLSNETSVGIGIDMTEIKNKELRLRKSRELLRKTFESLRSALLVIDPDERSIVDCNKSTERIFGYSRDELIGSSTRLLHLDEDRYREFGEFSEPVLSRDGVFHTEFRMRRKNGEPFDTDHTVTLVRDEEGEIKRVVSVVRDITDRKKAQDQLEQSEKRYRFIFENNPEPMWIYDPESLRFVEVNRPAVRKYGYSKEEFLSMSITEILLAEVHHRVKNNLAVISGLLQLQKFNTENPQITELLSASTSRIKTMALIHEKLYQSNSLSNIDFGSYMEELILSIKTIHDPDDRIEVDIQCDPVELNVNQAVPCGLILNEVISNAFKHAFEKQDQGEISVHLAREGNRIGITVLDNGKGLPLDFDSSQHKSMGFTIIYTLIDQLEADLNIRDNGGTYISFTFELQEIKGSSSNII